MTKKMNLDRLEELLEEMEPAEIREQFADELASAPDCLKLLSHFENMDNNLSEYAQHETPPSVQLRVRRSAWSAMKWALPLAAVLMISFLLWVPSVNRSIDAEMESAASDVLENDSVATEPTETPETVMAELEEEISPVPKLLERKQESNLAAELPASEKVQEPEPPPLRSRTSSATEDKPTTKEVFDYEPALEDSAAGLAAEGRVEDLRDAARPSASKPKKDVAQAQAIVEPAKIQMAQAPMPAEADATLDESYRSEARSSVSRQLNDTAPSIATWLERVLGLMVQRQYEVLRQHFAPQSRISWPQVTQHQQLGGLIEDLQSSAVTLNSYRLVETDVGAELELTFTRNSRQQTLTFDVYVTFNAQGQCASLSAKAQAVVER